MQETIEIFVKKQKYYATLALIIGGFVYMNYLLVIENKFNLSSLTIIIVSSIYTLSIIFLIGLVLRVMRQKQAVLTFSNKGIRVYFAKKEYFFIGWN